MLEPSDIRGLRPLDFRALDHWCLGHRRLGHHAYTIAETPVTARPTIRVLISNEPS